MSKSIRFEFYNNFNIWYDLYQENGGDPNSFINMIVFTSKETYKDFDGYEYEILYELENKCELLIGFGVQYEFGFGNGDIYGNTSRYGLGFEPEYEDNYGYGNGFCYGETAYGSDTEQGNGNF